MAREALEADVKRGIEDLLDQAPDGYPRVGEPDPRWYWAAPLYFDKYLAHRLVPSIKGSLVHAMEGWSTAIDRGEDIEKGDEPASLRRHIDAALSVRQTRRGTHVVVQVGDGPLGPRPPDLAQVLTQFAIAGPGVCAIRALSRVAGGPGAMVDPAIRERAYQIAHGLRTLFRKREIGAVLGAGAVRHYWREVLKHGMDGCLQAVLDEYTHVLVESEGLQDIDPYDPDLGQDNARQRAERIARVFRSALRYQPVPNNVTDVQVAADGVVLSSQSVSTFFAAKFGRIGSGTYDDAVRTAFNSPFRPFVLASTSVGQEGLDFHTYCHAIVHWNLPSNPVDLEQREGRIHRYKGHAVRKNIAAEYSWAVPVWEMDDPWEAMFDAARSDRPAAADDIWPYWVFTRPEGAVIERYVPAMPLSREIQQYRRLSRTLGAYRLVMGQPRQPDLMKYLRDADVDVSWLGIDLSPTEAVRPSHDEQAGGGVHRLEDAERSPAERLDSFAPAQ